MTEYVLAQTEEEKEQPRLWSKGFTIRAPVDDIAPEHARVDVLLCRWGMWVRRRTTSSSLASIESLYTKSGTPPATAPLSADARLAAVEYAVQAILFLQHRRLLIMMYVFRCSNYTICRAIKLPFEAYCGETYRARGMVQSGVNALIPGVA